MVEVHGNADQIILENFKKVNSWGIQVKVTINKKNIVEYILLEVRIQWKLYFLYKN